VSVTFRRARADDAALLAGHRAQVWREVTEWEPAVLRDQAVVWTDWFARALADGTYVAWVVEDDGAAIGSGALLIQRSIPHPGSPSDREGRVHSVYVEPALRRRGIARALMQHVLAFAHAEGLYRLTLHPSEEARPLYASMGFVPLDEMGLRLAELQGAGRH
jgi:GNAT superfamily N-acetyltransferase